MSIDLRPHKPARGPNGRMFGCIFRQRSRTRTCPSNPRLDGRAALVTGGGAGVGEFITRGLLDRGASVTSLSRGVTKGTGTIASMRPVQCDLTEPASVVAAVDTLEGETFDLLICNSGIVAKGHQQTSARVEKTFGVNVLGHHLLYRLLIERNMFTQNARIVMTSGDAYVMANGCESNPSEFRGHDAYAGSKLGNLWQVMELSKRYEGIQAYGIHPGVVLSGFGGHSKEGFSYWLRSMLMISEEEGAQSALIAATQGLPNGAYWHNTIGLVDLPPTDSARDEVKAVALWDELETLISPWLKPSSNLK